MLHPTLKKADIVEALYTKTSWPHQQSKKLIDDLIDLIKENIKTNKKLVISGFGAFEVNSKHARKGRNPATSSALMLDGRDVVVFHWSRKFRYDLNREETNEQK